eukprot:gene6325-11752_t
MEKSHGNGKMLKSRSKYFKVIIAICSTTYSVSEKQKFSMMHKCCSLHPTKDYIYIRWTLREHAPIDKEIYLQQPRGYEQSDKSGHRLTCHLYKSL